MIKSFTEDLIPLPGIPELSRPLRVWAMRLCRLLADQPATLIYEQCMELAAEDLAYPKKDPRRYKNATSLVRPELANCSRLWTLVEQAFPQDHNDRTFIQALALIYTHFPKRLTLDYSHDARASIRHQYHQTEKALKQTGLRLRQITEFIDLSLHIHAPRRKNRGPAPF